jgi:hypothetical protein
VSPEAEPEPLLLEVGEAVSEAELPKPSAQLMERPKGNPLIAGDSHPILDEVQTTTEGRAEHHIVQHSSTVVALEMVDQDDLSTTIVSVETHPEANVATLGDQSAEPVEPRNSAEIITSADVGAMEQGAGHLEELSTFSEALQSPQGAESFFHEAAEIPINLPATPAADLGDEPASHEPSSPIAREPVAARQAEASADTTSVSLRSIEVDAEQHERLARATEEQQLGRSAEGRSTEHPKLSSKAPAASGQPEGTPRLSADRPRAPRLSPEEYEQPFVPGRVEPPSPEYALWNRAIVFHCLNMYATESEEIYLTITPRVLAGALAEVADLLLPPEEASTRFVDAVSAMYSRRVLPHARKLEVLRRCGPDGLPECVAFLALSVLAAYKMHTEEGVAATAYYKRLEELLRCGLSAGLPRGFDGDDFEGLWFFLRAWFLREHRRQLAMPGPEAGVRRFVALPLTHVPLRQVDIERLPDFFDWVGYEPGERVPIEKVSVDLIHWARARGGFTVSGMDALADDRRAAVLAQIAHELECWDGSHTDSHGRRMASVEVFLYWERRLPVLAYLPRRPAVFPTTFNDGAHIFDAGEEGWYEPFPIGVDGGAELRAGFAWEATADSIRVVLRRTGGDAIAMAPSEFDGPVSRNGLLLGTPGAVLCGDSVVERVKQYLESVTGKRCSPVNAPNLPAGWKLITGVNPIRRLQPPDGLGMLDVAANVEIIPNGGLRLGRRWAWLAEAPPTFVVGGLQSTEPIMIDGGRCPC